MSKFFNLCKRPLLIVVLGWFWVSVLLSMTFGKDTCGVDYPVKSLFYSDLFCPVQVTSNGYEVVL